MRLPNQPKPIMRSPVADVHTSQIGPSGICEMACNLLSGDAKTACLIACGILR